MFMMMMTITVKNSRTGLLGCVCTVKVDKWKRKMQQKLIYKINGASCHAIGGYKVMQRMSRDGVRSILQK